MNTFKIEKFTPSFGSEILDELYKETPICQGDLNDFLNLPLNENYKKDESVKEISIEKDEPIITLGIEEEKGFLSLSPEDFKSSIQEE